MALLINLLPQERQSKLRDKRNRVLALTLSIGISGALIAATIVLFITTQAQEIAISRLQSDIEGRQQEIAATPNLREMVTLQQNLKALPPLYGQRRVVSQFFELVEDVEPDDMKINTLSLGEGGVLQVSGQTSSFRLLTKFVKAMERAGGTSAYFSNVKIPGASGNRGRVNFTLTATVAPVVTSTGGGQ